MKELNLEKREFTKAVKICAERWKKLSVEEKAPFVEKSKAEFEIYKKKMITYKQTSSYLVFKKLKSEHKFKKLSKKAPKDPNRPKQPLSGYFRFLRDYRLENPKLSVRDIAKLGGKAWGELDEAKKKKYVDTAAEKSKAYAKLR